MNSTGQIIAIIGAIFAGILSIVTAIVGSNNHNSTHERIDTVVRDTVPADVVNDDMDLVRSRQREVVVEQAEQNERLDILESKL